MLWVHSLLLLSVHSIVKHWFILSWIHAKHWLIHSEHVISAEKLSFNLLNKVLLLIILENMRYIMCYLILAFLKILSWWKLLFKEFSHTRICFFYQVVRALEISVRELVLLIPNVEIVFSIPQIKKMTLTFYR